MKIILAKDNFRCLLIHNFVYYCPPYLCLPIFLMLQFYTPPRSSISQLRLIFREFFTTLNGKSTGIVIYCNHGDLISFLIEQRLAL